jgi:hypothetical protein
MEKNMPVAAERQLEQPVLTFYRAIPGARTPIRADPSALGIVPTRAFQYCEALRAASAYGWYVFPPIDFSVQWDGSQVTWTYRGAKSWFPLQTAQFPGYAAHFDRVAPKRLRGMSPPFLTFVRELSVIQVWTGMFVETAEDWSALVRPPANYPRHHGYDLYEGIVETDRWFGPLFTNIRLIRTDVPIDFSTETPLVQVQPLQRRSYVGEDAASFALHGDPKTFPEKAWTRYEETIVKPNRDPERTVAAYAIAARKRRKGVCPVAHAAGA